MNANYDRGIFELFDRLLFAMASNPRNDLNPNKPFKRHKKVKRPRRARKKLSSSAQGRKDTRNS
jgi:hypothetical protein